VLRNYPASDKPFSQFLGELKERTLKAFENQDFQFDDLVDEVVDKRDLSRNPLFDVMFVLHSAGGGDSESSDENAPQENNNAPALQIKPYSFESHATRFDLILQATEGGERLTFRLDYCTALFKEDSVQQFTSYYLNIISSILDNPGILLADIQLQAAMDEEEMNFLMSDDLEDE
jgi:non-ribosomal peptide synthetase component F